jgi:hypothetical protein
VFYITDRFQLDRKHIRCHNYATAQYYKDHYSVEDFNDTADTLGGAAYYLCKEADVIPFDMAASAEAKQDRTWINVEDLSVVLDGEESV